MKVYFDFGVYRRILVCHEMAKYWKEKYGINDFAGMVAVKSGKCLDYLKNQKDINYHFLDNRDAIEEEALKIKLNLDRIDEIEKKMDIPLWYFIVADRNMGHFFVKGAVFSKTCMMSLSSHENVMRWFVYYYDLLEKRLDEFKPDAVVFSATASLPPLLLAKLCELKNIPYYELVTSRIKNLYSVIPNSYKQIHPNIIKDYESIIHSKDPAELICKPASEYVDSFKHNPKSPDEDALFRKQLMKSSKQGIGKILMQTVLDLAIYILGEIKFYFIEKKKNYYLRKKRILSSVFINMRRKLIARSVTRKFFDDDINRNDKYVLFALHLNPEATTMILAPNFVNQLSVIETLAKNIPITHKLYVKEHFVGVGTRPSQFYKEIKKYPNVKLVGPWADMFSLIKNSSLVVTMSGTAGFEAALMKKPAVVFSETFYSKAGLAEYCSDLDKLGDVIKSQIFKAQETDEERRDLKIKALVTAIYQNSFEVNATDLFWGRSKKDLLEKKDDLNKVAEEFYKEFKKNFEKNRFFSDFQKDNLNEQKI